jgi:hypothetical protein
MFRITGFVVMVAIKLMTFHKTAFITLPMALYNSRQRRQIHNRLNTKVCIIPLSRGSIVVV